MDVSQLAVGAGHPALAEATVEVVRPGDRVRISNVLDVVLPDVVADRPERTFPGVLGSTAGAPIRSIHRLGGVAVVPVCDWESAGYVGPNELPESLIDMAGPASDRSPWGATTNVIVRCVPRAGASVGQADAAVRRAAAFVARELAATTRGSDPDHVRSVALPTAADPSLPGVAVILQVASEGTLVDTFFDGEPLRALESREIAPADLAGGRLTNGAYDWPGVRNTTAVYQDLALLRELGSAHGSMLRFAGVILAAGYLDTAEAKRRGAEASAVLAERMGAAGVICTTFSSGNSHTDTMLTVRACERRGIAAVALVCELSGGLTDHVPEATSLISTGNEDELVDPWTPDRVIGGPAHARIGLATPMVHYLGSCAETGDARWTAVPA
jgi:glycine reductase